MENDMYKASLPTNDQTPMIMDATSSHMFPNSFSPHDFSYQRLIINGHSLFSNLSSENVQYHHIANSCGTGVVDASIPISRHRNCSFNNAVLDADSRENIIDASLRTSSAGDILAASTNFQGNFVDLPISASQALPFIDMRTLAAHNSHQSLNSSISASVSWPCGEFQSDVELIEQRKDSGLNYDEIIHNQAILGKGPSYHATDNLNLAWGSNKSNIINPPYGFCVPNNELSLSLATCAPSLIDMPYIPDQCSEASCSAVTQATPKDSRYSEAGKLQNCSHVDPPSFHNAGILSEHTSSNCKELSQECGLHGQFQFSHILLGSKYLRVTQQILSEVACYALESDDCLSTSQDEMQRNGKTSFSAIYSGERGAFMKGFNGFALSSEEDKLQGRMKLMLQREEFESKRAELFAMLQVIDRRYEECLNQIRMVTSAFHIATESDTQFQSRFALWTVSAMYKSLRDRITSEILSAGECLSIGMMQEKEQSFDSSSIHKHWAMQQLRNDPHSWRPQRGLPEKSVAVLRAWMFQNFLHPYPKDAEKHALAIRSGLTRNQVSNWFINARVRLWKPMIEEMYSDINGRGQGAVNERRSNGVDKQRT